MDRGGWRVVHGSQGVRTTERPSVHTQTFADNTHPGEGVERHATGDATQRFQNLNYITALGTLSDNHRRVMGGVTASV